MIVVWSRHARQRFLERSSLYGLNFGEVELNVLRQKVKIKQSEKNTIKTIFKSNKQFFTVIKKETRELINVVSIWEASEKEVDLWKRK
jgi:hypothetical protein